jgi:hypothetical protein
MNEWERAIQPAVAACPTGQRDPSKVDWASVPFVQPFN